MRKRILLGLLLLLVIMVTTGCGEKEKIRELEKELSETNQQLTQTIAEKNQYSEQLSSMTEERDSYKEQLEIMTKERDELAEEISSNIDTSLADTAPVASDEGQTLINLMFPIDGKKYSGGEKVTYYKDFNLGERVGTGDEIIFISKEKKEVVADKEKGLKVWIARSETGLLYSANKPNLKEIKSED